MFRILAASALLLLPALAACGQSDGHESSATDARGTESKAVRPIRIRNSYQEQMLALSELDRSLALRRAVRDDGGSCPKIRGSKYQQDYKGMAMWVAHCVNEDWAVFLAPSGTIQARPCKQIDQLNAQNRQMKMPACHAWPADPTEAVTKPRWPEPEPPPPALNQF